MAQNDQFSSILSKILEDPQSISRLMEIASTLGMGKNENQSENNISQKKNDEIEKPVGLFGGETKNKSSNTELLMALKPFLKEKRRDRVDKIITLWQVIESSGILNK